MFQNYDIEKETFYRLYYIHYHPIGKGHIGTTSCSFESFSLPKGMEKEDAFKVLSYLTDFIEQKPGIEKASLKSLEILDSIIDLEDLGFKRRKYLPINTTVVNLYTVTGIVDQFEHKFHYSTQVNWYTPNITKEEVKEIYSKKGIVFPNERSFNIGLEQESQNVSKLYSFLKK